MKKLLYTLIMIGVIYNGFAQTVFWSDDFESGAGAWQTTLAQTGNAITKWGIGPNSGTVISGVNGAFIVCTVNGGTTWNVGYIANMIATVCMFTSIDASNYQSLSLQFKWKCAGEANYDYGFVGYSLDGGSNYTLIKTGGTNLGKYYDQTTAKTENVTLPSVLDGKSFKLGFFWTNDAQTGIYPGFVIDDLKITGSLPSVPPVADFTASNTTIQAGDSIQFTDLSSPAATQWLWTLTGGTPSSSTIQNPWVKYNTAGTFNASLKAINQYGNNTKTKANYITVEAPISIIQVSPSKVLKGQTYTMTIMGYKTEFDYGTNTVWFTNGTDFMYATSPMDISATQLTAQLVVPSTAVLGKYEIHVKNSYTGELVLKNATEVVNSIGISDNDHLKGFTLYPNPATQYIKLNLAVDLDKNTFVNIVDQYGRLLYSSIIPIDNMIDINDLPSGIYILNIVNEHYNSYQKFQKE